MTQLLIAFKEKQFSNAIQSHIDLKYALEVLTLFDSEKALAMLEILPEIKLIVCSEKFGKRICEYILKNQENFTQKIQVLILGKNNSSYSDVLEISPRTSAKDLTHYIGFYMGLEESPPGGDGPEIVEEDNEKTTVFRMPDLTDAEVTAEVEKEIIEYLPINTKYFLNIPIIKTTFDIYSRIQKDEDFAYNVTMSANSEVTRVEIERIIVRSGEEFYVKEEDFSIANDYFSTCFLNRFKDPDLSVFDRMLLNAESYEILLEVFRDSSFTKYSIEIIKELIKSIDYLSRRPSAIEEFFKGLGQKKLSYGYCHSFLTGLLILKIIENFEWKKDQSKNKILYLALFHDLALHNSRLIGAHHNIARDFNKLSEAEKQILNTHADVSASILEKIVKAPKELTLLIREHHGLKTGIGFSESHGLGIGPLSMAYMVTEDFVTAYLNLWQASDKEKIEEFLKMFPEDIFKELNVKYDRLTYADAVNELRKFIKGSG
jgi:HD-GYP domain-containing protein (c-di-GMP phosphodiesterase class II)